MQNTETEKYDDLCGQPKQCQEPQIPYMDVLSQYKKQQPEDTKQ